MKKMDVSKFYADIEALNTQSKSPVVIESSEGAWFKVNGREKLNFCSSHYLGLGVNNRVKESVKKAVEEFGVGTGYRTLAGTNILNVRLEEELAKFKGAEECIVLSGGYMANCAAIQTIIGKEDVVISDELNHASIIDAVRLSQVKNKLIYKHLDMANLEEKLKEAKKIESARVLIVTDGVFSMDGDLAPLPDIVELANKYGALTMVDDAHGEGVLGKGGRGIVDLFNLHGKIDIEVGTLSKAFSVMGGYIIGKKQLITYYKRNARQFLFSNALTIPDTAAALEGVKILMENDSLVKKLWENTDYLKEKLVSLGFNIGNSKTPITPIMLGDEDLAVKFSQKLMEGDVFASAIKFPMVPKGTARIRIIPSAAHSIKDLDFGIEKIKIYGKELNII